MTFITKTDVHKTLPIYQTSVNLCIYCKFVPVDLHLLEAPHAVQDVELLPAFGEVDLPVDEVRVPKVDEGQVLENETPGRGRSCVTLWMSLLWDEMWLLSITYRYGMHGGSTSARAALYALKDEELSIKVQYSSNPLEKNEEGVLWDRRDEQNHDNPR